MPVAAAAEESIQQLWDSVQEVEPSLVVLEKRTPSSQVRIEEIDGALLCSQTLLLCGEEMWFQYL